MSTSQHQHDPIAERSLELRRARRRQRWRVAPAPELAPEPADLAPTSLLSSPEDLMAAARQCVLRAEHHEAAGDRARTLACLSEAAEIFAALDDFEAAALAGGAAAAGRLDVVLDELLLALDAQRA